MLNQNCLFIQYVIVVHLSIDMVNLALYCYWLAHAMYIYDNSSHFILKQVKDVILSRQKDVFIVK